MVEPETRNILCNVIKEIQIKDWTNGKELKKSVVVKED